MDGSSSYLDFDVCVIGAGVAGCCTARELARYDLSICVIEADNDVAGGISRANSGIVHAGFDPRPGSLKARFDAEGSRLFPIWAKELGFMFRRNGSMVLAFDDGEVEVLNVLAGRAALNGVAGTHIVDGDAAREMEPNVSDEVVAALVAPTGGICDPYGLVLSAAENAVQNGVRFFFNSRVDGIEAVDGGWLVKSRVLGKRSGSAAGRRSNGIGFPGEAGSDADGIAPTGTMEVSAKVVVNASGLHSDTINSMVSGERFEITPCKGEYYILDTQYGAMFDHTMFQTPGGKGKGVVVTPTIHGNLLLGPNAEDQRSKADFSTSREGLDYVVERARRTWPEAGKRGAITSFAGLRASGSTGDFVIGEVPDAPGFFNIACFDSPGLTSAPAVGTFIAGEVAKRLGAGGNGSFEPRRPCEKRFSMMDDAERAQAIARDPREGHIVCRCCNVSEAEVVRALHGPLPVDSVDGVKWRTSATMGRCHGGFCTPEITRIMSRELGLEPEQIDKRHAGSWMFSSARDDFSKLAENGAPAGPRPGGAAADAMAGSGPVTAVDAGSDAVVRELDADVVVVGAGAAGLAAAASARRAGAREVVLLDRDAASGGVMRQCVHDGFGIHRMGEELTGPEFAAREEREAKAAGCIIVHGASVLRIDDGVSGPHPYSDGACGDGSGENPTQAGSGASDPYLASCGSGSPAPRSPDSPAGLGARTVVAVRDGEELFVHAGSVVLATGSRERGFGALDIVGTRPAGIYTAGCAQTLMNLYGCIPGTRAVVLGSGDIGLIMSRRMALSGIEVRGVYELQPYPSGLRRNVVQCLDDFGIPLHLSRTVVRVAGDSRLEAVEVEEVDPETLEPIPGTGEWVACDTLVLSCGLIPENEVAKTAGVELDPSTGGPLVDDRLQTSVPGIFACGNSLHVHDLADYAAEEGELAGRSAAMHAARVLDGEGSSDGVVAGDAGESIEGSVGGGSIEVVAGDNVRYAVPQAIVATDGTDAGCRSIPDLPSQGDGGWISETSDGGIMISFRVSGVIESPVFLVVGVDASGEATVLSKERDRVAVPAQMRRMRIGRSQLDGYERVVVSAISSPSGKGKADEG